MVYERRALSKLEKDFRRDTESAAKLFDVLDG
jgi:hypothetical protein